MSDKDLQVGKIEFNNFNPNTYLNKILSVEESVKMQTNMDNKVFQLAQKLKDDMANLKKDYKNGQIDEEYLSACYINTEVTLDFMEEIWDVNLDNYRTDIKSYIKS